MSTQLELELYYIPNDIPLNNVSKDEIRKQIELNLIKTISKTIYELFKIFYENYMINSQYSDLLYKDLLYNLNESNAKEIDKYKDFIKNSNIEIKKIFDFLKISFINFNLNNLKQFSVNNVSYDDSIYKAPLHTIRTDKIKLNKYNIKNYLPANIIKQYSNLDI